MINKPKILIICEGYEETEYLESIKKLNVWDNYDIDLINAESNGSLFSLYQYHYQNDNYDLVLIMADTDRPTYDSFLLVLKKINDFHDVENFADNIVIFGNPCTMQIILNHFSNECIYVLKSNKKKNGPLIYSLTGVADYDAHADQRKAIFDQININNYNIMKTNISKCSHKYYEISSTNFLKFVDNLELNDYTWIDNINNKI